jgi:hypothetical protein
VDLGFSLTVKAGTVTIFSRHTVLFQANDSTIGTRILLGSVRPPRGRQSRNESQEMNTTTIALAPHNSNTICPVTDGSHAPCYPGFPSLFF